VLRPSVDDSLSWLNHRGKRCEVVGKRGFSLSVSIFDVTATAKG